MYIYIYIYCMCRSVWPPGCYCTSTGLGDSSALPEDVRQELACREPPLGEHLEQAAASTVDIVSNDCHS